MPNQGIIIPHHTCLISRPEETQNPHLPRHHQALRPLTANFGGFGYSGNERLFPKVFAILAVSKNPDVYRRASSRRVDTRRLLR